MVACSKLSFHIDCVPRDGAVDKIIAARPRLLFVTHALDVMQAVHARVPECVIIARDWKVGQDFASFWVAAQDAERAAYSWFDAMEPIMRRAKFAYWQSFNEMTTRELIRDYAAFELMRQRIMGRYGYRACLFNWSTGMPEIADWQACLPALREADSQRNIVGLHEYWPSAPWIWYSRNDARAVREGCVVQFPDEYAEGWLFGRYRKLWRQWLLPYGLTHVRVALTEMGCGLEVVDQVGYLEWKTAARYWSAQGHDPLDYYFQQLLWCDKQMRRDAYMIGGCIFVWGTIGSLWQNFDIDGPLADKLIQHICQFRD